jgi:hypothetical protein
MLRLIYVLIALTVLALITVILVWAIGGTRMSHGH